MHFFNFAESDYKIRKEIQLMQLSKRQFETLALYSKGLKFKEIGLCLKISERTAINHFMNIKKKKRTQKATRIRQQKKAAYKAVLKSEIKKVQKYNQTVRKYKLSKDNEVSTISTKKITRIKYLNESLLSMHRSYYKHRLKEAKCE
jgi:DNA-binding CsgD family transcriptional regulator